MKPQRSFFLFVVPIALAVLSAVPGGAARQQANSDDGGKLARDAYEILDRKCGQCHGADTRGGFTFRQRETLLKFVKPGDVAGSRIHVRISEADADDRMPPTNAKDPAALTASEKQTIENWITAGAPEPGAKPAPAVPPAATAGGFISEDQMLSHIEADLRAAPDPDRKYLRYFTLTHLKNAGESDATVAAYASGLSKLLNSLSWEPAIVVPTAIDPDRTIFRVDIRKYRWDSDMWKQILAVYPYGVSSRLDRPQRIYALTDCPLSYIRGDWFVANAALPPLYHDLLKLPKSATELESLLGVDVNADIERNVAKRAGMTESGVSDNNRIVERHQTSYGGAYWRSYDFSSSSDDQDISLHPLDFHEAGGEIIFNLPNGLQAYMLVNGRDKGTQRIDIGPANIVNNAKDPNREVGDSPLVVNGLTCMSCHTKGMQPFADILRPNLLKKTKNDVAFDYDHALALYIDKPEMDSLVTQDAARFAASVRATGAEVSSKEPILALQRSYKRTVSIAEAAAEAGFTEADFKLRLDIIPELGTQLSTLRSNESIKRDTWEKSFGRVVTVLQLGTYIGGVTAPLQPVANVTVPPPHVEAPPHVERPSPGGGLADGRSRINAKDHAEMVFVPGGPFEMGDSDIPDNPRHTVTLSGYYIYKNLVTVAMYRKYCEANGKQMPSPPSWGWKEDHPIVNVSWDDAKAYCDWAGARLPTEAEWEKAARGTDGRKFPWTGEFDQSRLWCSSKTAGDAGGTHSVGGFPSGASPCGALDMAGNVWQWCEDYYDKDFMAGRRAAEPNPVNETASEYRVLRGGSWGDKGSDQLPRRQPELDLAVATER